MGWILVKFMLVYYCVVVTCEFCYALQLVCAVCHNQTSIQDLLQDHKLDYHIKTKTETLTSLMNVQCQHNESLPVQESYLLPDLLQTKCHHSQMNDYVLSGCHRQATYICLTITKNKHK